MFRFCLFVCSHQEVSRLRIRLRNLSLLRILARHLQILFDERLNLINFYYSDDLTHDFRFGEVGVFGVDFRFGAFLVAAFSAELFLGRPRPRFSPVFSETTVFF